QPRPPRVRRRQRQPGHRLPAGDDHRRGHSCDDRGRPGPAVRRRRRDHPHPTGDPGRGDGRCAADGRGARPAGGPVVLRARGHDPREPLAYLPGAGDPAGRPSPRHQRRRDVPGGGPAACYGPRAGDGAGLLGPRRRPLTGPRNVGSAGGADDYRAPAWSNHGRARPRGGAMATFVLIPGAGGAGEVYWREAAAELRARGHEAIPVEIAGDDPALGPPEYAVLVDDAIGRRTGVVLVAHSMGGFTVPMIGKRAAVSRIVLLNAMIPLPGETPGEWFAATRTGEARRAENA